MSDVININGTKYTEEDFNEEQSYFIKQIRSLKVKSANIKFELDQVQVAENAFTNAFMVSMKASEDAKSETEVKTDEVVEVNTEAK
jgi:hypothetical protein|tara:strand:+ start:137 stop:394 length:258 start_codon:yes stop_codon:yes gene_type:complete